MALLNLPAFTDALDDLLDRERRLILAGSIETLVRLSAEKERFLVRLPGAVSDPQVLERLRRKADRNQELLAAAARGIKSVSRRLEAIKSERSQLQTYDSGGQRIPLAQQKSSFEQRS